MEELEDLECNNLKIWQDKKLYTFTSDSVILANFIKLKASETAVEIGGGSGVISILLTAKNNVKKIKIFEIQEKMQKLCKKNIIFNNLQDKLSLICDDVKNYKKYIDVGSIDVMFSNPPFFPISNYAINEVKSIAKEERCLSLGELVDCASGMLKYGGRFYVVYKAERLGELIVACEGKNLTLKKMFFTENGKGVINLIVAEFRKGGGKGVKVLPNLVTNKSDGEFLEELKTRKFLN